MDKIMKQYSEEFKLLTTIQIFSVIRLAVKEIAIQNKLTAKEYITSAKGIIKQLENLI